MKFIKENLSFVVMILIIIIGFIYIKVNDLELRPKNEVVAREYQCYWWFNDVNGNGMSTVTDYCVQLKNTCTASWHNLPCQWKEETIFVDDNEEEIGRSPRGCYCQMIW